MQNKEELLNKMQYNIKQIALRKEYRPFISNILNEKRGWKIYESSGVLIGQIPLESLSNEYLFWLCDACNAYPRPNTLRRIDTKLYFTNTEHTAYKASKCDEMQKVIYPIVFDNLLQVTDDQWVGTITVDQLIELYNNQIIAYNFNTQRSPAAKQTSQGMVYRINVNKRSVNEIQQNLERGVFIPNAISLNLNLDNEELIFEADKNTIVLRQGQLDIIDGYHRFRALIAEKMKNPDFHFTMIINFMNFEERKAQSYIVQEDKRNKINKQHIKALDSTNIIRLVVNKLNQDPLSCLYGKISSSPDAQINDSYIFNLLDMSFDISIRKDAINLGNNLIKIFNSLTDNWGIDVLDTKTLTIIIRAIYIMQRSNIEVNQNISTLATIIQNSNILEEKRFNRMKVNKALMNYIDKYILTQF